MGCKLQGDVLGNVGIKALQMGALQTCLACLLPTTGCC